MPVLVILLVNKLILSSSTVLSSEPENIKHLRESK